MPRRAGETATARVGNVVRVLPGRSIAFSPEWRDDGLSVLFDRNSGDYWVVSALARKIVESVVRDDVRSEEELTAIALYALSHDGKTGVAAETARGVLGELVRLNILALAGGETRVDRTDGSTK